MGVRILLRGRDPPIWREQPGEDVTRIPGVAAGGAAVAMGVPGAVASGDFKSERAHKRVLQTVTGRLVDAEGSPVADAEMVVRAARQYVAGPEKLPAKVIHTGADGSYVLGMAKADALCVDISGPGLAPVRRWFIALTPGGVKRLPKDQSEIVFVSPDLRVSKVATYAMAGER